MSSYRCPECGQDHVRRGGRRWQAVPQTPIGGRDYYCGGCAGVALATIGLIVVLAAILALTFVLWPTFIRWAGA